MVFDPVCLFLNLLAFFFFLFFLKFASGPRYYFPNRKWLINSGLIKVAMFCSRTEDPCVPGQNGYSLSFILNNSF